MVEVTQSPTAHQTKDTTAAQFRADVLEASLRKLVLVLFWCPRAQACSQIQALLERFIGSTQGKADLVRVNAETDQLIAEQLEISSLPSVVAFQRGRPVDGFVGALSKEQIKGFLERLLGPIQDEEDALKVAQEMIVEGDVAGAHALLSQLTAKEPFDPKAFAMLARLYISAQQTASARTLIERLPESLQKDSDVSAVLAIIDTMERAANLDEIEALQQKVRANPNDLQAYFDLALGLNAKDNRDEAAQALLEIIKKDRSWSDDGARKQLVQFFEAWGPMDKATISARRRLSGLLFS